ncbi:DUF4864 domain-containing protein [Marinovum sp.]|uniref:DUF4864 domain-containing protein n=1 Tax=Marinovum sp. TaxID=2024839 RepID=UPI002B279A83|nr:DUF4864 domain-containing protein [Marinovum sp.]
MLRRCLAIVAFVLAFGPAVAQEPQPRNPEIEAVIGDQLQAFEAQDVDRAFSHASPTIKGIFGSSEVFGLMVRRGYPMVWQPGEVTYLDLAEIGGALWQRVEIIDRDGQRHYLGYRMEPGEGGWKIGGVQLLEAPDIAV